ncbi:MAG: hypothetical protein K6G78_03055 [bacterium]|nr:hypothetical protein [bacterium]
MNDKYKSPADLPKPQPRTDDDFGVDANINLDTIDEHLFIDGVVYRDMRLLEDSCEFDKVGGARELGVCVQGYAITPLPYIFELGPMRVAGAYRSDCLFSVDYEGEINALAVRPNYKESLEIVEKLFPRDKVIFLMCGGGGYAAMTRSCLIALGYDPDKIYHTGGGWDYAGKCGDTIVTLNEDGTRTINTNGHEVWSIDFSRLTPID